VITHRYFYSDLQTEVRDALNHKTLYDFTSNKLLTNVSYFNKDESLHSIERSVWDNENKLLESLHLDANEKAITRHVYNYDEKGNISKEEIHGVICGVNEIDVASKKFEYSNDEYNLLLREERPNGKVLLYSYYPKSNRLKSVFTCDHDQILLREFYEYDENTALITKTVDDGKSPDQKSLRGITEQHITRIKAKKELPALGLPEVIEEFALDLQTHEEVLLQRLVKTYSNEGWLLKEELYDANNDYCGAKEFAYDSTGNITMERKLSGDLILREYDANFNLIREEGPRLGIYTSYEYDFSNRLIRKTLHDTDKTEYSESYSYNLCHQQSSITDIYGNTTDYKYDALGSCIELISPANEHGDRAQTSREYDINGNVISETNERGETTCSTYNIYSKPLSIHYPDDTEERFIYSLDGSLIKQIAKNGSYTTYTYDVLGRILSEAKYDAQDQEIKRKSNRYNSFHCIESIDPEGNSSYYTYDYAGRLIATSEAENTTKYGYDSLGRQVQIINPEGSVESKSYDILGRVIEERLEDQAGNILRVKQCGYDANGNQTELTRFIHNEPQTQRTVYNAQNEVILEVDADGNETHKTYNVIKNDNGQYVLQISTTDPLGQKRVQTFDPRGLLISLEIFDPFNQKLYSEKHIYDISGLEVKTIHTKILPNGERKDVISQRIYTIMGRLERLTEALGDPEQRSTYFTYDGYGRRASTEKASGVMLYEDYDSSSRLARYYSSDLSFDYSYVYNAHEQLVEIHDNIQQTQTSRTYDEHQHLIREEQDNGLTLETSYDKQGRKKVLRLPDQSLISYSYDEAGMTGLERLSADGQIKYSHQYKAYDLSGRLILADNCQLKYDKKGRLISLIAPHYQFTAEDGYDPLNNLKNFQEKNSQGLVPSSYTYDSLYQIEKEDGYSTHSYQHDSLNNRLKKDSTSYEVNTLNQIIKQGDTSYVYDYNGNLIQKNLGGKVSSYRYDALDRLIKIETPDKKTITYTYDSFNRRMSKTVQCDSWLWGEYEQLTERYLYDGLAEIGSFDKDDGLQELRILGHSGKEELGATVAVEKKGKIYSATHNYRGDLISLRDPNSGKLVHEKTYNAFGELLETRGNVSCSWGFSSKRTDQETGWIYFGNRYYDPEIGRWTTPDPIGYGDGPNLYAYVHNQALSCYDLYGTMTFSICASDPGMQQRCQTDSGNHAVASTVFFGLSNLYLNAKRKYDENEKGKVAPRIAAKNYRSCNDSLGFSETRPQFRYTYANGMMNSPSDARETSKLIAKAYGGVNVSYSYNASAGILVDSLEVRLQMMEYCNKPVKLLAQNFRQCISEMGGVDGGGTIIHTCHSQGAIITHLALGLLTPEERQMIETHSFGGAAMICRNECRKAYNYVSTSDPVPKLSSAVRFTQNYGFGNKDYNLEVLPSKRCLEHSIDCTTYQNKMNSIGNEHIRMYGKINEVFKD
jgi:RHS repeat-associated protein